MPCIARRDTGLVLRGRLTTFRRRCGKPGCRCADGALHESPALTYTEAGRTKTVTLSAEEVGEVQAALARYEHAKTDLDAQAAAGLVALRGRRAERGSRR
jgi:hypothetical protein